MNVLNLEFVGFDRLLIWRGCFV